MIQQFIFLIFTILFISVQSNLNAKCYSFRKTNEVKVCINGDSNADRRKAQEICKQISNSDCGMVSGYTGSCNKSNQLKCYDENGKTQKSISVD